MSHEMVTSVGAGVVSSETSNPGLFLENFSFRFPSIFVAVSIAHDAPTHFAVL